MEKDKPEPVKRGRKPKADVREPQQAGEKDEESPDSVPFGVHSDKANDSVPAAPVAELDAIADIEHASVKPSVHTRPRAVLPKQTREDTNSDVGQTTAAEKSVSSPEPEDREKSMANPQSAFKNQKPGKKRAAGSRHKVVTKKVVYYRDAPLKVDELDESDADSDSMASDSEDGEFDYASESSDDSPRFKRRLSTRRRDRDSGGRFLRNRMHRSRGGESDSDEDGGRMGGGRRVQFAPVERQFYIL